MWSLAFFHAPDDTAARSTAAAPDLTADVELSTDLSELEHFLTDRPIIDVICDDDHLPLITDIDINLGATDSVCRLTDTLRDALAGADRDTRRAASRHWPVTAHLIPVADSAVASGNRLYVRSSYTGARDPH